MKRKFAVVAGAAGAAGAALGALVLRRRRTEPGAAPPAPDPRAAELGRKLAEARATAAEEEDFEAAGMAGETVVTDETPAGEARATREDVDAARRRVHEEGRAAAEEMRRAPEGEERS